MDLLRVAKQRLDSVVLAVTSVVSFCMIVIVFVQVIARYVMHDSLSWSEEIARYLLVWTIFLSAGYVLGQGAHIFLDVVFNAFPKKLQKIFRLISNLLLLAFSYVVTQYGIELVQVGMKQKSSAVGIPMSLVYLAIPVGGGLLLLYCLFEIVLGREESK
jgi:TRAP-type transport system small permease protein